MADIVIHTDPQGDDLLVDGGLNTPLLGIQQGERRSYVFLTKDEAPQVAAKLASAITGEEMVVVPKHLVNLTISVLTEHECLITADALRKALGPEPCPAFIDRLAPTRGNDPSRCTLPKGHDGDHIPPATAWTVPS